MAKVLQQSDGVISFDILIDGTKIKDTVEINEISVEMEVNRITSANIVMEDGGAIGVENAAFVNSEGNDFIPGNEIEVSLGYDNTKKTVFKGQEANQGPYKLQGPNGELFVLIVSGSETVYVNGIPAKRGEDQDYIIDYNAGEIIFNATFPITSEMRITVDYQFSDRNYSRFIAYGGGKYESEKLKISTSVYTENDAKNQPLQQNLSSKSKFSLHFFLL